MNNWMISDISKLVFQKTHQQIDFKNMSFCTSILMFVLQYTFKAISVNAIIIWREML